MKKINYALALGSKMVQLKRITGIMSASGQIGKVSIWNHYFKYTADYITQNMMYSVSAATEFNHEKRFMYRGHTGPILSSI